MLNEEHAIELLELLARYDYLLEQLEATFSSGFNHLSRANYHNKDSIRGRYGSDYWDQTFKGSQFVTSSESGLALMGKEPLANYLESFKEKDEDVELESKNGAQEDTLRKRKDQMISKKKDAKTLERLSDPIFMFGGALSVPSSLRQCQSSFKGSLGLIIELVNCRRKIDAFKP
ncbi:LANO_0G06722g1_1 [Lachancea nothofagi CBS 11611]|uniref:Vacuolar ATPase assembly protein VMA22 n=1 Tax=Lachancea nothofagi CBS 11611 TaxID=1266666 RepID=A0A1G4KHI7_9SACH|nr:LANO_0G06722g1_1 [Lachancea nothofagi CBS 11611]